MTNPPKFVFTCQKCGRCCQSRKDITVLIEDLERWWLDGNFSRVFPLLEFIKTEDGMPHKLVLKNAEGERTGCFFLNDSKTCDIYSSRPLSCSAYPLGYNGSSFTLKDEECPGFGQGEIDKDALGQMRNDAKMVYEESIRLRSRLPVLMLIFQKDIMEQSREAVEELSEDEKKKLDEIFGEKE